jgi:energy-coupling factor transporter transmembrane protein EcfT
MVVHEIFCIFFTWGVFLPYWTVWLVESKHFTVEEAGIIVGTGLATRALSSIGDGVIVLIMITGCM